MKNEDKDTSLTDSDRFVANWIIERMNSLTDAQRENVAAVYELIEEREAITEEARGNLFGLKPLRRQTK